jgi:ADP-ribose pyrophosphatase
MNSWKKVGTKQILKHPRLDVYEDDIILPSGTKSTYVHFGDAKDGTAVIAIRNDGKILVQKEFSYPSKEWLYQIPGGSMDEGETALDGAIRELSEESNLTGDFEEIGWFYADNRRKKDKVHVFVVTNLTEMVGQKDDEEEFIDFWLTTDEVKELIVDSQIVIYSMLSSWAIYTAKQKV